MCVRVLVYHDKEVSVLGRHPLWEQAGVLRKGVEQLSGLVQAPRTHAARFIHTQQRLHLPLVAWTHRDSVQGVRWLSG